MKKILLLSACLVVTLLGVAQNKSVLKSINEITFYGVDFYNVKVYGAKETPTEFKQAFEGINELIISEPEKYNIASILNMHVKDISIDTALEMAKNIDLKNLKVTSKKGLALDDNALADAVNAIPANDNPGVGVVFVAEQLDKSANKGFYHVVFFDEASKEILDTWRVEGKAGGFGLRNFWAASFLKAMKSIKI